MDIKNNSDLSGLPLIWEYLSISQMIYHQNNNVFLYNVFSTSDFLKVWLYYCSYTNFSLTKYFFIIILLFFLDSQRIFIGHSIMLDLMMSSVIPVLHSSYNPVFRNYTKINYSSVLK